MWCRNALAVKSKRTSVAAPRDRRCSRSVFTGDFAWHSRCAKRREIVRADQASRRLAHRRRRRAARWCQPTRPASRPGRSRPVQQQVRVVPRDRREPRVEFGRRPARTTARRRGGGSCALTPRTQAVSGRATAVSKWTICDVACTPASVRPAAITRTGASAIARERALERVLHAAAGRLRLEAAERAPVVLEASAWRMGRSDVRRVGRHA